MTIVITTNGAATGVLIGTLPAALTAKGNWTLAGRSTGGSMCVGITTDGSNDLSIVTYTSAYPGADGVSITVSGDIEVN
jgi:hypothetical protein